MAVVGSSLLSVLDRLAFEVLPETGTITSGSISKINHCGQFFLIPLTNLYVHACKCACMCACVCACMHVCVCVLVCVCVRAYSDHHWPWVSVPLNSRPMTSYGKGGTTPHSRVWMCQDSLLAIGYTLLLEK